MYVCPVITKVKSKRFKVILKSVCPVSGEVKRKALKVNKPVYSVRNIGSRKRSFIYRLDFYDKGLKEKAYKAFLKSVCYVGESSENKRFKVIS